MVQMAVKAVAGLRACNAKRCRWPVRSEESAPPLPPIPKTDSSTRIDIAATRSKVKFTQKTAEPAIGTACV